MENLLGVLRQGIAMRYAAVDSLRERYPVSILCAVLEVSKSGYYEWRNRSASARTLANDRLVSEIRVLHAESFGSYGSLGLPRKSGPQPGPVMRPER